MATEKQRKYAEARGKGLSREQSALMAGYTAVEDPNTSRIEKAPAVQQELARIRKETAENTGITKEEVVGMLVEAATMAKLQGDPVGLVSAARELGKMLGFYAPEVKKTLHGVDQDSLKAALASMPDEELLKLANAKVIDGQAERVG